ncbi:MAG: DPP IV N-terminal domain-containing protein [Anaerolineae bacterium]|nr:DPP IV N-terminal domain-containing protein [Anaerolineae bacterium]
MVKRIYVALILTMLLGILPLASADDEGLADYRQDCLTPGELSEYSFPGVLFYLSPDRYLWRTTHDWQPETVLPETRVVRIISDRNYAPQILLLVEGKHPTALTTVDASGTHLESIEWQDEWTSVEGLTQDGRLMIERESRNAQDNGIGFATFGGQTTYFTDFPHALIAEEISSRSSSLSATTGFYISPDGQLLVYDAFFEAEKAINSRRGLALVDVASQEEIWRTYGNHIWDKIWSYPHWSPDGKRFAYITQDHDYMDDLDFDVEIAFVDRTGRERIMTDFNTAGATFRFPTWLYWSPDGSKIAFWVRDKTYLIDGTDIPEDTTLHIYDLAMNIVYDLCVDEHFSPALTWSPDGSAIAYSSNDHMRLVDLESRTYVDTPLQVEFPSTLAWLAN